jgi:serine/threonine-protein kinase RsbW
MKAKLVLDSRLQEVVVFGRRLRGMLTACDFPASDMLAIQLAVEEAVTNAVTHGNRLDRSKHVQVTVALRQDECRIRISDEGEGFDHAGVCCDPIASADSGRTGKRGLWLMRRYMHEVRHNRKGNVVTLVRRRRGAS